MHSLQLISFYDVSYAMQICLSGDHSILLNYILLYSGLEYCYFLVAFNRTIEVPSSRIVIVEGIYALSEKLRPLIDLRVSVTGGVHFDLVKRVLRDIQRAGQEPEEIIQQISETVSHLLFLTFTIYLSETQDI